jgi:hypothetical protein
MKFCYVQVIKSKNGIEKAVNYRALFDNVEFMVKVLDVVSLIGFSLRDGLFGDVMQELGFQSVERIIEPDIVCQFYVA